VAGASGWIDTGPESRVGSPVTHKIFLVSEPDKYCVSRPRGASRGAIFIAQHSFA